MTRFPADLAERVLASHPMPIADALAALLAADSVFEMRDRVVEVFRAELRLLGGIVLAARLQIGSGPSGDSAQIPELLRGLRARGLTDGQWVALLREVLRPWAGVRDGYPLQELVGLMHARKSELARLFDELLVMRKSETVAHGATGTRSAIEEILGRRVPQLARTLELLDPLWSSMRLCVPLAASDELPGSQSAWLLAGTTPYRGRFRKVEIASVHALPVGEAVLVDRDGKPLVALHPIGLFRRPSPEAVEELFLLDGGTKRGALYVAFPAMSEHRESDAWAAIEGALSDAEPASAQSGAVEGGRPYRGLSSFGPADTNLFFGREEQAESLANRIRKNGWLTVTGPSGSGKTSLLRAGVLPLLGDAITTFVRPGSDPLGSLAAKIAATLGLETTVIEGAAHRDPNDLSLIMERHAKDAKKLHILVVDQGEECLTLCHDAEAREAFGRLLARLASVEGSVRVVFGVREDFFGRLATLSSLRGIYSANVEVVTTPDRTALLRTLVLPAQAFGYSFEDEELVTTMLDAIADAPAALALLQFCADRLWDQRDRKWKRLTWDAYRAMGGVAGALASHADTVLASMSSVERSTCRTLFLRLVSGERTRTVLARSELLDGLRDPEAGGRALDALVSARLVAVSDDASGDPIVEMVHEALIKHWAQLDRWLGEDEEGQKLLFAMRQAAREWNARERPRDLVWRGDLLAELRRYRRRAAEPLAGTEAAFADASEHEAKRGRRIRTGLIGAALALTSGFSVFAAWQWRSTEAARVEAERARTATAREKVNVEARGLIAEARGHEPKGRTGHALALLRAANALESEQGATGSTLLSLELERLERSGAGAMVLSGHASGVYRACVPGGTYGGTYGGSDRVVTSSYDETVRIWQASTGRLLSTIPSQASVVTALACSPDGSHVATGTADMRGNDAFLSIWRVDDGSLVRSFAGPSKSIDVVEFSSDGTALSSFGQDGKLWVFDVESGAVVRVLEDSKGKIDDYDATPDGDLIATVSGDGIELWSPSSTAPDRSVAETARIVEVALSDDGTRLAYSTLDGGVVPIIDTSTGEVIRTLKPAGSLGVAHVRFAPGSSRLVTSGPRGIDVWNAATGTRERSFPIDPKRTQFYLSPDGARMVSFRGGLAADVWDLETGARLAGLSGHEADIDVVAFSEDGDTIVTGSFDKTARVHDIRRAPVVHFASFQDEILQLAALSPDASLAALVAGKSPLSIVSTSASTFELPSVATVGGAARVGRAAFRSDGRQIAVGLDSKRVHVLALPGAEVIREIDLSAMASVLAWSKDGNWLAIGATDGALSLVEMGGSRSFELPARKQGVALLAFDPKAQLLAMGHFDGTVKIVRVPTLEEATAIAPSRGSVTAMAFSPDGSSLAIADNEKARWIDVSTWRAVDLDSHEQAIVALDFSPDGGTLATASADQLVTLHEDLGRSRRVLSGHTQTVTDVVFSADGARLLSAAQDGTVRVWDVALGATLDVLEPSGESLRMARFLGDDRVVAIGTRSLAVLASRPATRSESALRSGSHTNLRVCRSTFAVVPVVPMPAPETVWAPSELCGSEKGSPDPEVASD